jgi:hypothetical protein
MAATIPHKFNIVQFQRPELLSDIEKFLTVMLNLCGIVVAILKMATGRNLSMSGINL